MNSKKMVSMIMIGEKGMVNLSDEAYAWKWRNCRLTSKERQDQKVNCQWLSMRSQCVQGQFETEPLVKEMHCGGEENGNESEASSQGGSGANIDGSRDSAKKRGGNPNQIVWWD